MKAIKDFFTKVKKTMSGFRILASGAGGHGNGHPPGGGGGGGGGQTVQRYVVTASDYAPLDGTTITITAQAKNNGNSNISEAGRVVTWSKAGSGGSFSSPTSTTNSSGVATVQFTVGSGGTTHTVTATDTAAKTGTSSPIAVQSSPPPPPTVDHYLVASSNYAPIDGTTVTITAQAKDAGNTNVPEAGRTITWSKTGAGGSFGSATSDTDANGVATVTFTVGAGGVTHTVTATDGDAKTGTSSPILVQASAPPPPSVDHYTITPSSLTPITATTISVVAQAKDAGNTNVAEAGRTVTWSKTGTGGSFSQPTSLTNASGIASVNFTVGAVGTQTVTGTDGGGKTGTSSPILVQAAPPPPPTVDHYAVTSSNNAPLAGATVTITAQAKDSNNVNVAEAGRVVTWSKTGSGGSFSQPTSMTNASGIASVNFTVGSGGTTHTVTATDASAKTGTSNPIVVSTPVSTVDHYSVSSSNSLPLAGAQVTITAQARDASNVAVAEAGRTVTWSKTGSGGSFSSPTSVTNSSGIATVVFTVGSVGVTHTVTGTDTAGKTGTSGAITVSAPSAIHGGPHEPAGQTMLYTHGASTVGENRWTTVSVQQPTYITLACRFAISGGDARKFKSTRAGKYKIAGVEYDFPVTDNLTFSANHVVTAGKFGVIAIQVNAAGVISTKVPVSPQAYATDADRNAAFSNMVWDPGNVFIAWVSVDAGATDWTANVNNLSTTNLLAVPRDYGGNERVLVDPTFPGVSPAVLELSMHAITIPGAGQSRIDTILQGEVPGSYPLFGATRTYISYWQKISAGFVGNDGAHGNKDILNHCQATYGSGPSFHLPGLINADGPNMATVKLGINASLVSCGWNGNPITNLNYYLPISGEPNDTGDLFSRGNWHFIEAVWEGNSLGQYNGRIQMWIDGVSPAPSVVNQTGADGLIGTLIQFFDRTPAPRAPRHSALEWDTVWGGGGSRIYIAGTHENRRGDIYFSGGYARAGERPNAWTLTVATLEGGTSSIAAGGTTACYAQLKDDNGNPVDLFGLTPTLSVVGQGTAYARADPNGFPYVAGEWGKFPFTVQANAGASPGTLAVTASSNARINNGLSLGDHHGSNTLVITIT